MPFYKKNYLIKIFSHNKDDAMSSNSFSFENIDH